MSQLSQPELVRVVQALLLAANEPLNLDRLVAVFEAHQRPDRSSLKAAVEQLQRESAGTSQELAEVAGGFRYRIRSEYAPWISRLSEEKPPRYSRALLETLALIAYRQPVTRGEIEDVRGVSVSSQIIRTLEEREWIRVIGYREVPGRPALYATTRHFLDYFGLKSLNQLPPLDALRELVDTEEEWHDELDKPPVSPRLSVDEDKDAELLDDPETVRALLQTPLPQVKELTFADLTQRFVQHQDDEPEGQ